MIYRRAHVSERNGKKARNVIDGAPFNRAIPNVNVIFLRVQPMRKGAKGTFDSMPVR